jgi:hypothetical protein
MTQNGSAVATEYKLTPVRGQLVGADIPGPTSKPGTLNSKLETRNSKLETWNPKPETWNPKPETRNLEPETRNPKPCSTKDWE